MVKDATTWKVWLWAPANFWVSLLVSTAAIHLMTSQALATEIQDSITSPSLPQHTDAVAASSKVLTFSNFSSWKDVTSNSGILANSPNVQDAFVDTSPTKLTRDHVTSETELSLNQKDSDTQKIQDTVTILTSDSSITVPISSKSEEGLVVRLASQFLVSLMMVLEETCGVLLLILLGLILTGKLHRDWVFLDAIPMEAPI